MRAPALIAAAALMIVAAPSQARSAGPVLFDPAGLTAMAAEASRYPLFDDEVARTKAMVDAAMRAGIVVPVPRDPGGGYTHEQHKRNYMALYGAGLLYRITGERAYADYARRMLLAYAKLYPTLGPHPAAANQAPGRLFWQSLNDSVWLVYAIQGYDAIRDTLSDADRKTIDDDVFRRMAHFLSIENKKTFDRIHNHATWAAAGVGMTGYVLHDPDLVARALKGSDESGKAGFLAQVDQLFSPDGYYTEGPYYQRYAIQPFVMFAAAIARNQPELGIWKRRDGVLIKAIRTTVQLTYDGYFFPLNDALRDKSLRTAELYQAIAIGYGVTHDPGLLSIAKWQGRTIPTPDGLAVARDLAAGKARPFPFASHFFRDGPEGKQGGIAVLRSGADADAVLVAKNSGMGMGHGHFDKLSWILYDAGNPIVTDYGAARFLNVESKSGGRYLPENDSWAKQTIAHNTLVVDERSNFDGDWREGEKHAPRQLDFDGDGPLKSSTAEMAGAWPGVTFRRTLVQFSLPGEPSPLVVDLLRVQGDKPATYDLPLHYSGHITDIGFPVRSNVTARPVLGKDNGYQHIWVDATGTADSKPAALTWINGDRFYTYHMLPPAGATLILGESGANDPDFNLRREPLLIERVKGARDATFVSLLEPHGAYDPAAETTSASASQIAGIRHVRTEDADLIVITPRDGGDVVLGIADDVAADTPHRARLDGRTLAWTGHIARIDPTENAQ